MRAFDFAPLSRTTVGFERLFDQLDAAARTDTVDSYPPYDIEKTGEETYRIVLAVAGFAEDDLAVTVEPNQLTVVGTRDADRTGGGRGEYLYRGIGGGSFERRFNLADHIAVRGARLENGLLTIDLERELPESLKPRRIAIGGNDGGGGGPRLVRDGNDREAA